MNPIVDYVDYVENSNNNKILLLIILLIVISGAIGVLYYFFVFKCNSEDDECTSTSDCCDDLDCINSICSSSTPTVYEEPGVGEGERAKYCDTWTCSTGKRLINNASEVEYLVGEDDCCVDDVDGVDDVNVVDGVDDIDGVDDVNVVDGVDDVDGVDAVDDIDCEGTWSDCNSDCERTFRITIPQSGGGVACPTSDQAPDCQQGEDECPPDIDCEVSWTPWSSCSVNCGEGIEERTGTVSIQQSGSGAPCGDLRQTKPCNLGDCLTEEWRYAINPGTDCNYVCEEAGLVCEDGDWGVHDETGMRQALQAAGQDDDTLCRSCCQTASNWDGEEEQAFVGMIGSSGGIAPYFKLDDGRPCRFRSQTQQQGGPRAGVSRCDDYYEEYKRLCKCVSQ